MSLISFKKLIYLIVIILLFSCSQQKIVEDHFKNHGISYPVDSSGLGLLSVEYSGIDEDELLAPGVQDYIESGLIFIKEYFRIHDIDDLMPGTSAAVLSDTVLFRDEKGEVGLMVKVTAYGAGKPAANTKYKTEIVDTDKKLWKVENFAYFGRDALLMWNFKGMVY